MSFNTVQILNQNFKQILYKQLLIFINNIRRLLTTNNYFYEFWKFNN